jgi:mono/diheme cytochrome c family protein
MRVRWGAVASCLAALGPVVLLASCTKTNNMSKQAYFRPYAATDLFPDGTSARPLEQGTVSREAILGAQPRPQVDMDLLRLGRERFDTYCSPCHGRDGYGTGMVVRRGFPKPPSYHSERLRTVTDQHIFETITRGLGKMPPYGPLISSHDRWAVVAYVRALQLSQYAPLDDVPDAQRERLGEAPAGTEGR